MMANYFVYIKVITNTKHINLKLKKKQFQENK